MKKQLKEERQKNQELNEEIFRQGKIIKELKFINKHAEENNMEIYIPKIPN